MVRNWFSLVDFFFYLALNIELEVRNFMLIFNISKIYDLISFLIWNEWIIYIDVIIIFSYKLNKIFLRLQTRTAKMGRLGLQGFQIYRYRRQNDIVLGKTVSLRFFYIFLSIRIYEFCLFVNKSTDKTFSQVTYAHLHFPSWNFFDFFIQTSKVYCNIVILRCYNRKPLIIEINEQWCDDVF